MFRSDAIWPLFYHWGHIPFQVMTFNNSPKGHKDEGMEEVADEQQVDPTGEQEDEVIDEEAAAEGWCYYKLFIN